MTIPTIPHALNKTNMNHVIRAAISLVLLALAAPTAPAQVREIEPIYITVTSPDAVMRCGPDVIWYAVARVSEGQTLLADGEIDGWYRAEYPPDGRAVVKLADGQLQNTPDGRTILITRRSRLRAYNMSDPVMDECWKGVLDEEALRPGAELPYLGDMLDRAGAKAGYVAQAPPQARAFISMNDVRPATDDEIAAYRASRDDLARAARDAAADQVEDQPDEQVTRAEPEPERQPEAQPEPEPEQTEQQPTQQEMEQRIRELEDDLRQQGHDPDEYRETTQPGEAEPAQDEAPVADPTDTPPTQLREPDEAPGAPRTEQTEQRAEQLPDDEQPADETAPETQPEPEPEAPRPVLSRRQLENAYQRVMSEPMETAEYDAVIDEFRRYIDTLGDDEFADREHAYMQAHIDILQIQRDLQENERRLRAFEEKVSAAGQEAEQAIQRLETSRLYDVVGRLMTSAIYDGKRLPLLYRLQSVSGGAGHTIAYLTPNPDLAMDSKLGAIVGVNGESRPDAAGRVTIIRPENVTVLTPSDTGGVE